ncbi:hypothetical protein D1007_49474 [Hordeum vulgare]|nr:hypothetical protein D1007_49474 [Hordeum vulgare]
MSMTNSSSASVTAANCRLAGLVEARIAGAEYAPAPRDGEVVLFAKHFTRGFGLPVSTFFRRFLTHFSMQPHHLGDNAILQSAAFVSVCEGYLGIEPCLDLSRRLLFLKQQTVLNKSTKKKEMMACGAALVYHRTGSGFPKLLL